MCCVTGKWLLMNCICVYESHLINTLLNPFNIQAGPVDGHLGTLLSCTFCVFVNLFSSLWPLSGHIHQRGTFKHRALLCWNFFTGFHWTGHFCGDALARYGICWRTGEWAGAFVELRQWVLRTKPPSIHLGNVGSLANKMDKLLLLLNSKKLRLLQIRRPMFRSNLAQRTYPGQLPTAAVIPAFLRRHHGALGERRGNA